jgi:DNA-binding GntR family transcriptional regulator
VKIGKNKTGESGMAHISSRHEVRENVQKNSLSGKIKPGTRLVQLHFAKKYGVTQNVVREALLELLPSGLVTTTDNKGFFVADLSIEKFLDFLVVRASLEGLAASLCCDRITRADIRELRQIAEQIKTAGTQNKTQGDIELDMKFHTRLLEISGNAALQQIIQTFRPLMQILSVKSEPKEVFREHAEILDAIEKGDQEAAEHKIREHILNSKKRIEKNSAV